MLRITVKRATECASCGAALKLHQAIRGGYCDQPRCRARHASDLRQRRDEIRRETLEQLRADAVQRGAAETTTAVATLPSAEPPLAPQEPERREAFRRHLRARIDEVLRMRSGEEVESSDYPRFPEMEASPEERALLGQGCAFCLGRCCQGGGVEAYLDARSLERFMDSEPDLGPEEILSLYISHLPEESYEGSCVFHGERGCGLDGAMRSDTCNGYFCRGLRRLKDAVRESGSERAVVASFSQAVPRRAALIDAESCTPLPSEGRTGTRRRTDESSC